MRGSSDRVKMTKKPRRVEAWLQINRELINRGPHGAEAAVGAAAMAMANKALPPRLPRRPSLPPCAPTRATGGW